MTERDNNLTLFFDGYDYDIYPNKFGMKYFAGAKRPEGAKTKREILELLEKEGITDATFYYPYPDYYFPLTIYSDEYLPNEGELRENIVNFDEDRFVFFDEGKAFDEVISDGSFPYFANSFVVVRGSGEGLPVFARFATDRDHRFAIATAIFKKENGYRIQKRPVYPEAGEHIKHIYSMKDKLKTVLGDVMEVNECRVVGDAMGLEYIHGEPLLSAIVANKDLDLLERFVALLRGLETVEYKHTEDFVAVFGEHGHVFDSDSSLAVTDIDLIPQNILVMGDKWVVIDYEWSFEFPIPLDYVIYRALTNVADCLCGEGSDIHKELYAKYGIGGEKLKHFIVMEKKFQEYQFCRL